MDDNLFQLTALSPPSSATVPCFQNTFQSPIMVANDTPLLNSIEALKGMMESYISQINSRLAAMEQQVSQLRHVVGDSTLCGQDIDSAVNQVVLTRRQLQQDINSMPIMPTLQLAAPTTPNPSGSSTSVVEHLYELVLVNPVTEWYTERAYPPFRLQLIDLATGQVCKDTNKDRWAVYFHLNDANGRRVDDKLKDDKCREQYLIDGETEVSGLKFTVVSSKNGGHFVLDAELVSPPQMRPYVRNGLSPAIQVLSCRLYSTRKPKAVGDTADSGLHPESLLSSMPGIAKVYADRFKQQRIFTIGDLAAMPLLEDKVLRTEFLANVRRDKGTLTEAKLLDLVKAARGISRDAHYKRDWSEMSPGELDLQPSCKLAKLDHNELSRACSELPEMELTASLDRYAETYCVENFLNEAGIDPNQQFITGSYLLDSSEPVARSAGGLPPDALFTAVASKKLNILDSLVEKFHLAGSKSDVPGSQNLTALMFACCEGRADMVAYLITKGLSDVNTKRSDGWTALHFSVLYRQAECTRILLQSPGIDANATSQSGWTPLLLAAVNGSRDVLAQMINAVDSNVFASSSVYGYRVLHLVAVSGNLESMASVSAICPPAEFSHANPEVPSVLHCAVLSKNPQMVQFVASRVSGQIPLYNGWSPLHLAAAFCSLECMKVLAPLEDVNSRTIDGWTPLSLCAMSTITTLAVSESIANECVAWLLSAGAKDDGSRIPASMVSVICSNLAAMSTIRQQIPEVSKVHVGDEAVDMIAVGELMGVPVQ